ncbi:MAG TPA: class I SAM-dependent methyltransferase [Pyrinomonadaceae bacterium]|nr:class I SAM-dependent methyltransferase [Pyrinomonadaceae bacterium]
MDITTEFNELSPWITRFNIEGTAYGGDFDAMNDVRIDQFFAAFPDVKTVLELGSLEGGHSFAIARHPSVEKVIAVEARSENIERAKFIKGLLKDEKVEFVEADLEKADLSTFGKFDAVLCSGLYHLPEPWKLVEQCGKVSGGIFIWTQNACENEAKKFSGGYRGKWYREGGWRDPLSGVSKYSFWLSFGSLVNLLTANGFERIEVIENNLEHPKGCAVTLAATAHS